MPAPTSSPSRHHYWHLHFTDDTTNVSQGSNPQRNATTRAALDSLPAPPGFPPTLSARDPSTLSTMVDAQIAAASTPAASVHADAKNAYKDSWSIAFSPIRPIVTSAFALYMAGNSVQFFSVASTVTVLFMHIRALFAAHEAFRPVLRDDTLRPSQVAPQFIIHLALCAVGVAFGLQKANTLGFLPTTESDYVALLPLRLVQPMTLRYVPMLR